MIMQFKKAILSVTKSMMLLIQGKEIQKNILEQLKNDEDYVQGILRYFCK